MPFPIKKESVESLRQAVLDSKHAGIKFPNGDVILDLIATIEQFEAATPENLFQVIGDYNGDPQGEKMYFLFAKDHSEGNLFATWWRPNSRGYTVDLNQAGRYGESQIQAEPNYYNTDDTVPIPVDDVLGQRFMKNLEVNALRQFGIKYDKKRK